MRTKRIVVAAITVGLGVLASAWEGQPAAVADFTFAAGSATPGNQFATAALDLPTGPPSRGAVPELTGAIQNSFSTGCKPIKGIKIWIESRRGDPIPSAAGGCPVTDFSNSSATGGVLGGATLAGQVGNVATFDLAKPISNGATGSYDMQIGKLGDPVPNQLFVKMQASYERADAFGSQKHFDVLGSRSFRSDDLERVYDVMQASIRKGVVLDVLNSDPQRVLVGLRVTVVSEDANLKLLGTQVEDLTGNAIAGAGLQLATDGKSIDISNLNAMNAEGAILWLDLNAEYPRDTLFRVRAIY